MRLTLVRRDDDVRGRGRSLRSAKRQIASHNAGLLETKASPSATRGDAEKTCWLHLEL